MRQTMIRLLVFLAACAFSALASAEPPDYVTAWPRQVPLEKPDPVLGGELYWEHWVYGEAFAKRFKGFSIKNADPELNGKLKAIVLRIFMKNFWQELRLKYPDQYACEVDVYFDSSYSLPLSESGRPRKIFPEYPEGIAASYRRLEPNAASDKTAIETLRPAQANMAEQPVVFAAPFDGRFKQFGVREYHPSLVPGLSVITLLAGDECAVTAPLQAGGAHWLSLKGERPWDKRKGDPPKAAEGRYNPAINFTFEPGTAPELQGYFRVPEAFNEAALPKATLIKVLNWCIRKKDAHANPVTPIPVESWEPIASRCELAEQEGKILPDPQYHLGKKSLQEFGF